MIDIHTHLLPNIDDGVSSIREVRSLIQNAIQEGITDICITPHFSRIDDYTSYCDVLIYSYNKLKEELKDININLYLGNEIMIDKDIDELLLNHRLLSLNKTKYVLIEFPMDKYSKDYDEYLYNISISGYKIIIAHPERYEYVIQDYDKYINHKWKDYYLQCNQNSLNVSIRKKIIYKLIDEQRLTLISSDAHNEYRPCTLIDAYKHISKKYNNELADILFNVNPKLILNNENVNKLPLVKRKLFSI